MSNLPAPEQTCKHLIYPLFVSSDTPVRECGAAAVLPSGMPTNNYVRCVHGHVSAKEVR